jgi:hypothetical protein
MPALRRRRDLEARRRHLVDLQRKVKGLLYGAATLFTGEATEETTLWRLFLVYGGAQYAGLAGEVRGWVEHAMSALREALLLSQDL